MSITTTANLRTASSSLFETIGETAQAITSTVNTLATGVHMINDFATDQRKKQLIRIAASNVGYQDRITDEAILEMATRKKTILDFKKSSPDNKELYELCKAEFEGKFDHLN